MPTWEVNPKIDRAWLAQQEADDPDMYRAEFGAEFVGGSGGLLDWDRVQVADYVELPPSAGRDWVMAVDVAVQRDPFAAVVVGRDAKDPERMLIGAVRAWRPGLVESFARRGEVEAELFTNAIELGRRYGAKLVIADQHLSKLVQDRFSTAGFAVRVSRGPRPPAMRR